MNFAIRSSSRIETGVQRSVCIQPCDPVAGRAGDSDELAANQHLAIRLYRQRLNTSVWTVSWIEGCVQRSVRIQPGHSVSRSAIDTGESPSDKHFSIGLQRD